MESLSKWIYGIKHKTQAVRQLVPIKDINRAKNVIRHCDPFAYNINQRFHTTIQYYFDKLTENQKTIYNLMKSGIEGFAEEIKLPLKPIDEISTILNYLRLDNPLIYYVSTFSQSSDYFNKTCRIMPQYIYSRRSVKENEAAIMNYLRVFDAVKTKSDFEKELFVHDYCLNNFRYDYSFKDDSFSIIGPVFHKTAVCAGIARFAKLAFDYIGIKSLIVSGEAKNPLIDSSTEKHAWNIVKIGGNAYHLDVTFDMGLTGKLKRYDYFNLSDEDIKKDHVINKDVPACTTERNDYYSINSLYVYSPAELEKHIVNNLKKGKKYLIVKLVNARFTNNVVDKVMQIAQTQYCNFYNRSVWVETSYNSSQMVFQIIFK